VTRRRFALLIVASFLVIGYLGGRQFEWRHTAAMDAKARGWCLEIRQMGLHPAVSNAYATLGKPDLRSTTTADGMRLISLAYGHARFYFNAETGVLVNVRNCPNPA